MSTLRRKRLAALLASALVASLAFAATVAAAPTPAAREDNPAAEPEQEGPPGAINWTDLGDKKQPPYLAALLNFALVFGAYAYFGKKPVEAALRARRDGVSKQIEEAQNIKREAEARSKQYASKLEALTDELTTTRATLVASGVAEKARIVREAEEKAARMQKDALFLLDQERRQVHADLQRETVTAALAAAEQILRTKLTQADQERVAEEFLATLAAPAKQARAGGAS
jgi:F-type H+-transporting ATPase subunit b